MATQPEMEDGAGGDAPLIDLNDAQVKKRQEESARKKKAARAAARIPVVRKVEETPAAPEAEAPAAEAPGAE